MFEKLGLVMVVSESRLRKALLGTEGLRIARQRMVVGLRIAILENEGLRIAILENEGLRIVFFVVDLRVTE
jgi:hypothetical protein